MTKPIRRAGVTISAIAMLALMGPADANSTSKRYSIATSPSVTNNKGATKRLRGNSNTRPAVRIGNSFDNKFEDLILKRLDAEIDLLEDAGRITHPRRFPIHRTSVSRGGPITGFVFSDRSNSSSGGLQEAYSIGVQRPSAKIIRVPKRLKRLAEARAERRLVAFEKDRTYERFRFYRSNEAYDPRFPSVVYLDTQ